MNGNTHTIKRLITGLVLATVLAVLVVPQALAGSSRYGAPDGWYPYVVSLTNASTTSHYGPPDGWYSYVVSLTTASRAAVLDGRSPDTKDAGFAAQQQALALVDGRSPDTQDAAQTAQANLLTPVDGRAPDTIDAATQAHIPVVTVIQTPGFQWGDFGIGVAAALGLICLLAVSIRLLTAHKTRKQPDSVATA
jgi:hypothetical protein